MKIDLHCHTKKTKVGDPDTRNVDVETFVQKVEQASVGMLAITNHNAFDYVQYCEFSDAITESCAVFPGIELDIKVSSGKIGHLIIVANPDIVKSFVCIVERLLSGTRPDDFNVDIIDVVNAFKDSDVFYIPHSFKKETGFSEEDINQLHALVGESFRVIQETTYKSLGVYANFNYPVIAGSDVRDWNIYETYTLPELRLPVKTFSQLSLLAQHDSTVIKTLLSYKRTRDVPASPYQGVTINISLYQDINVIFGQKGTGKTELLKSIHSYCQTHSLNSYLYIGSTREEIYKAFEDTSNIEKSADLFGIDDCTAEFSSLRNWGDSIPCLFTEYYDYIKTVGSNKAKLRLGIAQSKHLVAKQAGKSKSGQYNEIKSAVAVVHEYVNSNNFLAPDDQKAFLNTLSKIEPHALSEFTSSWIDATSLRLTNQFIDGIKKYADQCSNTKSRPNGTGFEEFALGRIRACGAAKVLSASLTVPEVTISDEYHGTIEGKGALSLRTIARFVCQESSRSEFSGKKTKLLDLKKCIDRIAQGIYDQQICDSVRSLNGLCEELGVLNITPFIGIRIITTFDDGTAYCPSSGEQGMLLFQHMLNSPSDVYILDEPEAGMGNSFIMSSIIPELIQLAKRNKTVVIATHNANIAVLTLPYMTIFREHSDGIYKTYTGNLFCDSLVNIEDPQEVKSWTKESMHLLEGGSVAFYGRKSIYESGD